MIERILPSTALLHKLQIYRKTKKNHKEATWQDFRVTEKLNNYFHILLFPNYDQYLMQYYYSEIPK